METNQQANSRLTHIWWLSREYLLGRVCPDIIQEILRWIARDSALDYWFFTTDLSDTTHHNLPIELALPATLYKLTTSESIENVDWYSSKDLRLILSIRSVMDTFGDLFLGINLSIPICNYTNCDLDDLQKHTIEYPDYLKQLLFLRAFLVEDLLGPRTHRGVLARIDYLIKFLSVEQ